MNRPFISVVIPVYNGSNYMREAVDSVLAQTYTNYEILLIDDGSKDNTYDIIQEYVRKYPNIIRGFHKENGGVSTALNLGIKEMRGEWFAWLSHDDLWVPKKLEKQVVWMHEHPGCGMYYCGDYIMDEQYRIILSTIAPVYPRGKDLREIFRSNYIHGITCLIHKNCFATIGGFHTDLRCVQDVDLWFRIIRSFPISGQKDMLAINRVHSRQVGVRAKSHCIKESRDIRNEWGNTTELSMFYPKLSWASSLPFVMNIYTKRFAIFRKYVDFCLKHQIPRLKAIIKYPFRKLKSQPSYEELLLLCHI